MNLYLTADRVGGWTGGSQVTFHESSAFQTLGPCEIWDRDKLDAVREQRIKVEPDPWCWDELAWSNSGFFSTSWKLCHVYAGTFTDTVERLKERTCKVTYTAAAHDLEASQREHRELGIPYDYPHLTNPDLWKRYVQGYLAADVVVCPSQHSATCMRNFGAKRVEVIPHGVHVPDDPIRPLPSRFRVGYLGAYGPDKGVRYLLEAWKRLDYKDATLVLAGRDSTSPWVRHLIERFGGGNIELKGFVDDVSDFYGDINLYVQPSVSEGFGIEVLEAMGRGIPVICSDGAGAADCLKNEDGEEDVRRCEIVKARDVDDLVSSIRWQCRVEVFDSIRQEIRDRALQYRWDKIQLKYVELWRGLLS